MKAGFASLDASRPWICYWIVHGLAMLDWHDFGKRSSPSEDSIIDFLASCQHPSGGFGGGPHQLPHLATSYAAVATLVTVGGQKALKIIDKDKLFSFFLHMCVEDSKGGGMTMHEGGEVDIRGCYCAIACCYMLRLDIPRLAKACSLRKYVSACQSAEGGMGGEPFNESHGGYTFCGFAALALSEDIDCIDMLRLVHWATRMQGVFEGGFMGRTCKLVDGCYSFWQGGLVSMLKENVEVQNFSKFDSQDSPRMKAISDVKELHDIVEALDGEAAFLSSLKSKPPGEAMHSRMVKLQRLLDDALNESMQKEKNYKDAVSDVSTRNDIILGLQTDALVSLKKAHEIQLKLQTLKKEYSRLSFNSSTMESLLEDIVLGKNSPFSFILDGEQGMHFLTREKKLYNSVALQIWLLLCCQAPKGRGGLRDKPGKRPDYYHTCYCLSGLTAAQRDSLCIGGRRNLLHRTNPLCNVIEEKVTAARDFFTS